MPIVGFVPIKARLVIDDSRDTVLVMRVVVAKGENIVLTSGGTLEALVGVLRIRERKTESTLEDATVGVLIYVAGVAQERQKNPPKFQLNLSMSSQKFASLLEVVLSGGLPTKFFVDVGTEVARVGVRGLGYKSGTHGRTKIWDTNSHRSLPLVGFSLILPVVAARGSEHLRAEQGETLPASSDQVGELAAAIDTFHAETKHSLMFMLALGVVTAVILVLFVLSGMWK